MTKQQALEQLHSAFEMLEGINNQFNNSSYDLESLEGMFEGLINEYFEEVEKDNE